MQESACETGNYLAPNRKAQVVIVGAGLAGLSAAQRLHELGLRDVIVLDALDRVGGRVHTINHSDYLLELGAQWLHGADENPLYQWLNEKNMLDDFEDASLGFEGLFCTDKGQQVDPGLVRKVIDILVDGKIMLSKKRYGHMLGNLASRVFREHLDEALAKDNELNKFKPLVDALFDWFLKYETIENSCDTMDEVSISSYTDWTDWGDGTLLNFKKGYKSLLDWFCNEIPAKDWIHLSKQVLNIEMLKQDDGSPMWLDHQGHKYNKPVLIRYNNSDITNQTKSHYDIIECDHVIVTVSLGFLKKNHEKFFRPKLPQIKQDLIESIGFGTVNKIILHFDRPFWNDNRGIKLLWNKEGLKNFPNWTRDIISFDAFDSARNQPNVLIGWIGGQGAKEIESESDERIAEICLQIFRQFLPKDHEVKPTNLIACFCSRWFTNPFICGSYSFQSMKSFNQKIEKLHEPLYNLSQVGDHRLTTSSTQRLPRVLFAGEATAGKLYSTTHGAIVSGWREAVRLIESLKGANMIEQQKKIW